MTKERLAKAKNLELLVTAGVGSDHIDLHAAAEKGLTVSEVTGMCLDSHKTSRNSIKQNQKIAYHGGTICNAIGSLIYKFQEAT